MRTPINSCCVVAAIAFALSAVIYGAENDDANRQFQLGKDAYSARNYDKAIIDYTAAIQLDPKFAKPYVGRQELLTRKKATPTRAISDYSEAIRPDGRLRQCVLRPGPGYP